MRRDRAPRHARGVAQGPRAGRFGEGAITSTTHALASTGKKLSQIPVTISYRIIELFSAGLYSSPNKAIEELVSNSYDALASKAHVVVPANLEAQDAIIWVIDDGESMDADGLIDLWQIASSKKRLPGIESKKRPPIGKFGIGKLATYVLARQLTHVCKSREKYLAVTMDFSRVDQSRDAAAHITLDVRSLTAVQARNLLAPVWSRSDAGAKAIKLFGRSASDSWTVAAMGNLTALAQKLTVGRLRWVLSTALPLSPQFKLYFNGERLESTREKLEPLKQWSIGKDDGVAKKLKLTVRRRPPSADIQGVGPVKGTSSIFEDALTGGKAEALGRSHGVFVMVRGRLVNIDDALFGLPQLSHGPFVRFRLEVHADGLDEVLRSTREAVLESEGVIRLREYIQEKFNEARAWYDQWLANKDYEARISTRVGATPQSLSRRPLLNAIRGVLDGSTSEMLLTRVPSNLDADGKKSLLDRLEADLTSETGLIKEVRFEPLGMDLGLAVFEAHEGRVLVNLLHPFYANYAEHYANPEPFELLAVAEVLTEAYLLEEQLSPDAVKSILRRRDRFLRELVYSRQLAAPLVAELLQDSMANSAGLEKAVAAALSSLGFEVSPIGGKGEPDGIALARLGVRDNASGARSDYKITYDAKSTGKDRVQAHTVGAAGIARHRRKYDAQYSLVVAPGFAASAAESGAIANEARAEQITLVIVSDLVRLVLVAATRQLGFTRLRDLFETCRAPGDAGAWIDKVLGENVPEGPLAEILEAIWELQAESPDPVKFAAVRMQRATLKKFREKDITEWMTSLRRLAGGYVTVDGDVVSLEAPPDRILREVRKVSSKLPAAFKTPPVSASAAEET